VDNGALTAYEFISSDKAEEGPSDDFVSEIFAAFKLAGLNKILGIRRINKSRKGEAFEFTPAGKRMSLTTFGYRPFDVKETEITKVLWSFQQPIVVENPSEQHCFSCGCYCGNCRSCHS